MSAVPEAVCAICGGRELVPTYRLPSGTIVRCAGCRTVARREPIGGDAALSLYEDDAYLEAPYFEVLQVGAPRTGEPYGVYGRVLDRLGERGGGRRLLDVGCSYGAFLELARERGYRVAGVELSRKAADYAERERGLDVFRGTLEEARLPAASFDLVTLWDVVEHLDRPVETLVEVRRVLAPGGTLMLFTINQRSLINRVGHLLYRASLDRFERLPTLLYDVHHNFFFDRRTLAAALRRAGFDESPEVDWMEARIERWQNVRIPVVLALGATALDFASRFVGERYRMIAYAQKAAPAGDAPATAD
ncbi:MAG TPA: class I SAM-dependent methyltransferase [Thermoanaerobaculia bacterium]|nr:class I SAM-dependent methyltransferase [Thermoanaerobaculia bacterium]